MLRDIDAPSDDQLIVGIATRDDAGVYRIADGLALVQTVDFFTPVVDDAYMFGQIAAANSLSDVYAMGGRPVTAMNILCWPVEDRGIGELAALLRGGAEKVAESGAVLVGGHSVEDIEPKFGLAVTGLVDPERVATNAGAVPGDVIVLTKALGTGVITTAAKFDRCGQPELDAACASMAALNAGAARAMAEVGIGPAGVHAATDITGFGLLGHLYHLALASRVRLQVAASAVPLLPAAEHLATEGNSPAGGAANEEYLRDVVHYTTAVAVGRRILLTDPQTSGGLAIVVAPGAADHLVWALAREGALATAPIGEVLAGAAGIEVM